MLYSCGVPKGLVVVVGPVDVLKVWRKYLDQHRVVLALRPKPAKAPHEDGVDQACAMHSNHHSGGGGRFDGGLQGHVLKGHCCAGAGDGVRLLLLLLQGESKVLAARLDLPRSRRSEAMRHRRVGGCSSSSPPSSYLLEV